MTNGDETQPMSPPTSPPVRQGSQDETVMGEPTHAAELGAPTAVTRIVNQGTAATVVVGSGEVPTQILAPVQGLDAMVGRTLGGCRVDALLGRGGMGAVFRAHQESLGRSVALKVMLPGREADGQFAARFQREARVVASINNPHVVQVFDTGRAEDGMLYLVMEYVNGRSLAQVIRDQGALSIPMVLAIIRQAAEGLAAAQLKSLVHRDIKPDNIMIDADARVKVMDFGLARPTSGDGNSSDSSLTMSGTILGTPNYISPEAARGEVADIRSDLYSLGVTMWQCLAGRLPFTGPTPVQVLVQHIESPPPALRTIVAHCPPAVEAMCARLLAKRASDRWQTPRELIDAIVDLEQDLCGQPVRLLWQGQQLISPEVVKNAKPSAVKKSLFVLAVGVGVVLVGAGWWLLRGADGNAVLPSAVATEAVPHSAEQAPPNAAAPPIDAPTPDAPTINAAALVATQPVPPETVTDTTSTSPDQVTPITSVLAPGEDGSAAALPPAALSTQVTSTAAPGTDAKPLAQQPEPARKTVPPSVDGAPVLSQVNTTEPELAKLHDSTDSAVVETTPATTPSAPPAPSVLRPLAVIPPPAPQRPASLMVSSIPSGVTIEIDGQTRGVTPARLTGIAPGPHTVRLTGNGVEEQVVVVCSGGQMMSLRNPLPQPARLIIQDVPKQATVMVSGRAYNADMPVETGTIHIQVMNQGRAQAYEVTTEPGKNIFILE